MWLKQSLDSYGGLNNIVKHSELLSWSLAALLFSLNSGTVVEIWTHTFKTPSDQQFHILSIY